MTTTTDSAALVYLECNECGFDAVVTAASAAKPAICPICAGDNGRDVYFTKRNVSEAPETVEGHDARSAT